MKTFIVFLYAISAIYCFAFFLGIISGNAFQSLLAFQSLVYLSLAMIGETQLKIMKKLNIKDD